MLLQGLIFLEVLDKDKYSRDDYIGGKEARIPMQHQPILASYSEMIPAGGFIAVQKYIDNPNTEFTETVPLFEKGIKKSADGDEHQGHGTDTGFVSC